MKKLFCKAIAVVSIICMCTIMFTACNNPDANGANNGESGSITDTTSKNPLEEAYNDLIAMYPDAIYCCDLATDKSYINFDTNPYDLDDFYSAERTDMLKYLNSKLNLPEYIYQDMITTRALDGKVTEEIGSIKITWTYHPDRGLEIIYKYLA